MSVAANIWSRSDLNVDDLKENLICITFAQPYLPLPQLRIIAEEVPDICTTLHAIQYEGDTFPRILMALGQHCNSLVARVNSHESGLQLCPMEKPDSVRIPPSLLPSLSPISIYIPLSFSFYLHLSYIIGYIFRVLAFFYKGGLTVKTTF